MQQSKPLYLTDKLITNQNTAKMDFITPIINIVWPIIKKIWPYLVFAALIATIALLYGRLQKEKADNKRNQSNVSNLLINPSTKAQIIELTKAQIRENQEIKNTIDSLAGSLKIKPKHVTEIHRIKAETVIVEKTKIDTIYLNENKVLTASYSDACIDARVEFADSANWQIKQKIDLDIIGHRVKPEKWFWRGLWNKNKWGVAIEIVTPCDSVQIKKNIKIKIK